MKQKVIMLVEANGNTALYFGKNADLSQPPKIGTGVAVYEMLTCIFNDPGIRNPIDDYNGIELVFFKDGFQIYDWETLLENKVQDMQHDKFFTWMILRKFAENNEKIFTNEWQGRLCTEQAIEAVLQALADSKNSVGDKTGFVFISDTPSVFDKIGEYMPPRDRLPDISVFCLNSEAVVRGKRFLSSFHTDNSRTKIFDYASVQNNMAQIIKAYPDEFPGMLYSTEDLVKFGLKSRCGVTYALYDAIKGVFANTQSYAR